MAEVVVGGGEVGAVEEFEGGVVVEALPAFAEVGLAGGEELGVGVDGALEGCFVGLDALDVVKPAEADREHAVADEGLIYIMNREMPGQAEEEIVVVHDHACFIEEPRRVEALAGNQDG